jgi:hypothetical protein
MICTVPFKKNICVSEFVFQKFIFLPIIFLFYHKTALVSSNLRKKPEEIGYSWLETQVYKARMNGKAFLLTAANAIYRKSK